MMADERIWTRMAGDSGRPCRMAGSGREVCEMKPCRLITSGAIPPIRVVLPGSTATRPRQTPLGFAPPRDGRGGRGLFVNQGDSL